MSPTSRGKLGEAVLQSTIAAWFRNFVGTSALDVARDLSLDHALIKQAFEQLAAAGDGSMNRDVTLYELSFDPKNIAAEITHRPVVTHIFFPSKQVLQEAFYVSDLSRKGLPEYTMRLHLGAHQLGLVYFDEEVLARYMNHPEFYEINDSLAGGDVSAQSSALEDRYLYVRYGKCRLNSGKIAVTAIYKDLSDMGKSEQRYWHSHELDAADIDKSDTHFQNFLARTYEGEFVDFEDPISRLREALIGVNQVLAPRVVFAKLDNTHLRLPVGQTYKSYCDAASELYKIVGPDNVSQTALKEFLTEKFATAASDFEHSESRRPLSTLQLLELLEAKLECSGLVTGRLRALSKLRVEADHKVLEPDSATKSYSREFGNMCNELSAAFEQLVDVLKGRVR